MPIPTPEEIQYLLGVHPDQTQAKQSFLDAANGGAQPESGAAPPAEAPPKPRPISTASAAPDANAEPIEVTPKPSLIPRSGPRGLDVPPVGTPGPIEGTVATGTADNAGRPMLAKAGPEALPVGAVPGVTPSVSGVGDLTATPPERPGFNGNLRPVSGDANGMSSIKNLMTTPIRPISGDQARENTDRAELDRLRSTGSGVDQFSKRHHVWGPIVKGLSIAGSVLAPSVAEMVPGTDMHHNVLVNQARGRVAEDIGSEKTHSQIATAEEAQQAREEANRTRQEALQSKVKDAEAKFVAGSEHEDASSPTGYVAQTVGGEWKPFTPSQSYRESKSETSEAEFKQRGKRADDLGLQGEDRKYFLANGKLREPNPNQPQLDEDRKARIQRQREHDQDARTQHYQNDHARWAEHKSAIEKDEEQGYAKIENDWRKKYGDVLDSKDTDPQKQAAVADLERQKKLLQDSVATRFKELGPEPQQPQIQAIPEEEPAVAPVPTGSESIAVPASVDSKGRPLAAIPNSVASVRAPGPAPIGGPVQTPERPAKPSPGTQAQAPGSDIGPAPEGSPEGRTGKLADGTKVVVKGGRLVAQ